MASNKLQRTNDDIQFVLANLLRQVKDPRVNQGSLISITRVDTTGDLRYCKVHVSCLGEVNEKEFKKGVKSASPWLRRELGSSLNLRYPPQLQWSLDDSITYGAKMLALINSLGVKHDDDEE
mgnify:CR=1 FL=1